MTARAAALPSGSGARDVERVRVMPTRRPRRSLRAARLGVLLRLEDERRGAVAEDEAVTRHVVRARGGLGGVVATRERLHGRERGEGQRVQRGLRATGDDDVRLAVRDVAVGLGQDSVDEAQAERYVRAPPRAPNSISMAAAGPFAMSIGTVISAGRGAGPSRGGVPGVEQRVDAADTGRPVDDEALGDDGLGVDARVGPRLTRGDERELRRGVEALRLGARQLVGEEAARLAGELDGDLEGRVALVPDAGDAGLPGEQRLPRLRGGRGEGVIAPIPVTTTVLLVMERRVLSCGLAGRRGRPSVRSSAGRRATAGVNETSAADRGVSAAAALRKLASGLGLVM